MIYIRFKYHTVKATFGIDRRLTQHIQYFATQILHVESFTAQTALPDCVVVPVVRDECIDFTSVEYEIEEINHACVQ